MRLIGEFFSLVYTQVNSKISFWRCRLCLRFFILSRALPIGNGRSLRLKNLRSLLAKIPIFDFTWVYWRLRVFFYDCIQQSKVRRLFYSDHDFKRLDQEILGLANPFHVPEAFPYGETPLVTLKEIADRFGMTSADSVFELGSGRGRSAFFLAWYKKCKVHGIEKVTSFVSDAKRTVRRHQVKNVVFSCGDMQEADLTGATFIYLYGTCLNDASIRIMQEAFRKLPKGTKIVTVSYPLDELVVKESCTFSFPWGKGEVFLHEI